MTSPRSDTAKQLAVRWSLNVKHALYRKTGDWYHQLERFPGALLDEGGYVLFDTEQSFRSCSFLIIRQDVGVPGGIKQIPGYTRVLEPDVTLGRDVDIHGLAVTEGQQQLVTHLKRERNQAIVRMKKRHALSLQCEVCGFSFAHSFGDYAAEYCEVHHLLPLADAELTTTRMQDLAILCSNCHRVIHLRNPPFSLLELREMRSRQPGA